MNKINGLGGMLDGERRYGETPRRAGGGNGRGSVYFQMGTLETSVRRGHLRRDLQNELWGTLSPGERQSRQRGKQMQRPHGDSLPGPS